MLLTSDTQPIQQPTAGCVLFGVAPDRLPAVLSAVARMDPWRVFMPKAGAAGASLARSKYQQPAAQPTVHPMTLVTLATTATRMTDMTGKWPPLTRGPYAATHATTRSATHTGAVFLLCFMY